MKLLLITERNNEFAIHRDGMQNTNDVNIAALLGATKHVWAGNRDYSVFRGYDTFLVKMSKIKEPYEKTWMEIIHVLRNIHGDNVLIGVYQEAEVDWLVKRPIDDQIDLIHALNKCDFFMAHNTIDEGFFSCISDRLKVFSVRTPLPIEKLYAYRKTYEDRKGTNEIIFGSSFDDRSYGLFGLMACKSLKEVAAAKLVQYCRSEYSDDRNNKIRNCVGVDFSILPRYSWFEFADRLSHGFVSMNLMLAAAAGRDAIMFAVLGIPHIGNSRLDAMKLCFPSLCIDPLDVSNARSLLKTIYYDEDFHKHVSDYAMKAAEEKFTFEAVKRQLQHKFKNFLGVTI